MTRWTCHRLRPLLVDHALGTTRSDERARAEAHLAACAACRREFASVRTVLGAVDAPASPPAGDEFFRRQRQAILRRVRTAPPPSVAPVRRLRWQVVGAIATVLLAIVVTHTSVRHRQSAALHAVDRLDDDVLLHLHELLPAFAPSTTIDDADSDMLSLHDLGDDDLEVLVGAPADAS
jgi:anti-sigma factor RsiW